MNVCMYAYMRACMYVYMYATFSNIFFILCYIRAGVRHPCVETKLTATKKSATDGN